MIDEDIVRRIVLKEKEKRGWTWQQFGDAADVSFTAIYNYANGKRNTSFAVLNKILDAVGLELKLRWTKQ